MMLELVRRRRTAGYTQEKLAAAIGKTRKTYAVIESGKATLSDADKQRIATELQVRDEDMEAVFAITIPKVGKHGEVEMDGDTYLPISLFMDEFTMDDRREVRQYVDNGCPHKEIYGKRMFPRNKCHRWFAGEEVDDKDARRDDAAADAATAAGVTVC